MDAERTRRNHERNGNDWQKKGQMKNGLIDKSGESCFIAATKLNWNIEER